MELSGCAARHERHLECNSADTACVGSTNPREHKRNPWTHSLFTITHGAADARADGTHMTISADFFFSFSSLP